MIQVRGLTKYYGEHAAIRNLDFDIEAGEVIGFLGLNGAGKTTTLKILSCLLLPTWGTVVVDGIDALEQPHELRKRIGFLPDTPPLYNEMRVGEYLAFACRIRGVASRDIPSRVRESEERTALVHKHTELIGRLSHGYRQRVGVAQALVHKPKLLILDEPTSGLDPVQIVEMRRLIQGLRGDHTLLISSHILAEISQTCDRLLVIQSGEIVKQGTEEDLARALGSTAEIELVVRGAAAPALEALRKVATVVDIRVISEGDGLAQLRASASEDNRPELVRALVGSGVDLMRIDRAAGRLENIFLRLAKGGGEGRAS